MRRLLGKHGDFNADHSPPNAKPGHFSAEPDDGPRHRYSVDPDAHSVDHDAKQRHGCLSASGQLSRALRRLVE
jgi:hypothetical protein